MDRYINAFKRMKISLSEISKNYYGKSIVFFYIDALWCYVRYGVTPNEYVGFGFYGKRGYERKNFYTARHHDRIEKHFNSPQNADYFWKKQLFNRRFKKYINRAWLFVPNASKEEFDIFISKYPKIIVKPQDGSSGKGIHIYDGRSYEELKQDNCLIEQFIQQHSEMASLNESSVNSVRVYTVLDKKGTPHILSISIRVGGMKSCVDNYHSGGVGYPVDIQSGVVYMPGKSIAGKLHIFHPGTNKKVVGFEIPNYKKMIEFVCKAASELPDSRLVAWDVAVLDDGFDLIEGNYAGDPGFMQSTSETGKLPEIKKYY